MKSEVFPLNVTIHINVIAVSVEDLKIECLSLRQSNLDQCKKY
jgi:hypothetical protein